MTQLELAKQGKSSDQMQLVARAEHQEVAFIREMLASGQLVIPSNKIRWEKVCKLDPIPPCIVCGIGKELRTKVNANIGTSSDYSAIEGELNKLKVAEEAGTDAVMDLSTGGDIAAIRRKLLSECNVSFGTVPIYEAVLNSSHHPVREKSSPGHDICHSIEEMTGDRILEVIEDQARDGVDFMTVHCGVTQSVLAELEKQPRVGGMVSRGGVILATWMRLHQKENPLYERFDEVLEIARNYDITLSLGDGLRPGALADSFDRAQIGELMVLSHLARRAQEAGVQVMIEGPGHVPLDQIEAQVRLAKSVCHGAPFYVLGPLVTDIAPGYDHITSAIGGALAAWAGADFLCYVTPMEHLGLPTESDVREGVIAARIAGHAADIAKGVKGAAEQDKQFSLWRRQCNWDKQIELALDPKKAAEARQTRQSHTETACSMCGEICVYTLANLKPQVAPTRLPARQVKSVKSVARD